MRRLYKSSRLVHLSPCPETFFRNAYYPACTFYGYAYPLVHAHSDNLVRTGDFWRVYFDYVSVDPAIPVRILPTGAVRPAAGTTGRVAGDVNPERRFAEPGLCSP